MVTKLHTLHAVEPQAFSYDDLPEDDRAAVLLHAVKIKLHGAITVHSAAQIGLQLLEAKGRLPQGKFGPWLQAEFSWSHTTADRYIKVHHFVRDHAGTTGVKTDNYGSSDLDNFDLSAIYRLVELDVPEDLKRFAFEMAADGQRVARRYLDAKLAEMRPAAAPTGRDRRPLTDTNRPAGGTRDAPAAAGPAPAEPPPAPWSWPSLHVMPGDESSAEAFARRIPSTDRARARKLADAWGEWLDSLVVTLDELAETPSRGPRAVA